MTGITKLSVDEITDLAIRALMASDVSLSNARAVARSIAAAERDGQEIVGLSYLPTYCAHAACGKVDGHAMPRLEQLTSAALHVDAACGFAHPAIELGLEALMMAGRTHGIAALSIGNSYACGSLGYFVETLAQHGLVALMTANTSPTITAYGGKGPFFGTNPIAFAVPRSGKDPLVIDQSSSVVAKVAVIDAHKRGVKLPDGWAVDAEGQPTNDASAAMSGALLPIGGYKGSSLALMVDVLAAGLTRSNWSFEASSFGSNEGGPPRTGPFFIVLDPTLFGGATFAQRLETMLTALLDSPGLRLPGERRLDARRRHRDGVPLASDLIAQIRRLGGTSLRDQDMAIGVTGFGAPSR